MSQNCPPLLKYEEFVRLDELGLEFRIEIFCNFLSNKMRDIRIVEK
jgi:hypothetical protein